jgi:uncharacterized protein YodC (DUF2158 family)
MKLCPQCGGRFGEENSFCLNDGTVLISEPDGASTELFSAGETPTRIVSARPNQTRSSSWLLLIIGVLAVALAGTIGYILFISNKASVRTNVSGVSNSSDAGVEGRPVVNANVEGPTPSPSPTVTRVSPDGTWRVTYKFKDGGGGYFDLRLKSDGPKLSVSTYDYSGSASGEWFQRQGSLNGNTISFNVGEKQGYSTIYSGKIDNGTMSGAILTKSMDTGKSESSGTWTGKKR